jgi:pimeloyl-ACP methyl ester carboxylesterase
MTTETAFRHTHIEASGSSVHVVAAGDPGGQPFVFLHGWPQTWRCWRAVMELAAPEAYVLALDLPGVGGSGGDATDGSKRALATKVHEVVAALGLRNVTLVGQDVGGMAAYAYLRMFDDVDRFVIMDTVIPGVAPWEQVLSNPYVWHFAFHSIPALPEQLVRGKEREYFDFFYDQLSPDPSTITAAARAEYVEGYANDAALSAGFSWYRTLRGDAAANAAELRAVDRPVLYLRGEREGGEMAAYRAGFEAAGISGLQTALVPRAGHFSQEDAPADVWDLVYGFGREAA